MIDLYFAKYFFASRVSFREKKIHAIVIWSMWSFEDRVFFTRFSCRHAAVSTRVLVLLVPTGTAIWLGRRNTGISFVLSCSVLLAFRVFLLADLLDFEPRDVAKVPRCHLTIRCTNRWSTQIILWDESTILLNHAKWYYFRLKCLISLSLLCIDKV